MSKRKPIDADTLPKVWKDGRLYAVVTLPGTYEYNGEYHPFSGPGTICLFSMNPEDWISVNPEDWTEI